MGKPKNGQIYLIPSEIWLGTGQKVLPKQTLDVLSETKTFLVENIRTSRRFISSLRLGLVIEDLRFELLNRRTEDATLRSYLDIVQKGENVGVLSEAGCPGIADPGTKFVALAHQKEIEVIPFVGPSSFVLALMASGLSGQNFTFNGYLPIDKAERSKAIKNLEAKIFKNHESQIFMETPFRNESLLETLISVCNKQLLLTISVGLNGPDQRSVTKPISKWKSGFLELRKIPAVFILGKDPFLKKGSKFTKK